MSNIPKDTKQIEEAVWEIPTSFKKGMNVPARIYATKKLLEAMDPGVFEQVTNMACLPGVQKYALAMPDAHWGYGFCIGGVIATDAENGGVISPGGVGFDINCGMKMLVTNLTIKDVQPKIKELVNTFFQTVPSGVGCKGFVKINNQQFTEVMEEGVKWCVDNGYGWQEDLERIESNGKIEWADSSKISQKARQRGIDQLGTLGSGNHYLEIQHVKPENIVDEKLAKKFGIFPDQIVVMFHTGSRGFGHQTATDYLKIFEDAMKKYNIKVNDRELSCAPFSSPEGQDYYKAMACAANMSFSNRQVILHRIREGFEKVFKMKAEDMEMHCVYDIAHNLARLQEFKVDGKKKKLIVHRKGATLCQGHGNPEISKLYRDVGSPIIIGGSMETGSYLLVGTEKADNETFSSTCFTGETKIITDKGLIGLADIYERFNNGEEFIVPSINEQTLKVEWKPIIDSMKREANIIETSISQRGKITQNRLRTTRDHKFVTIEDANIIHKKVESILEDKQAVMLLDNLKVPVEGSVTNEMAYLVGAIMADGYFEVAKHHGRITFTQKKVAEKMKFIEHVCYCFKETFSQELIDKGIKGGGGNIRGRQMYGYATDFICNYRMPAEDMEQIYNNLDSWILSLSKLATLNFIAGVIDGDGTWNKKRKILEIFNGDEKIVGSIVLACLKLGILPYVSKQRKSCYIIQISEKENLLFHYTKRVRNIPKKKKYGAKLYAAKQLFDNLKEIRWPFLHKALRNNLMSDKQISNYIYKYPDYEDKIRKLINSSLRMQRLRFVNELGKKDVYNITVEDNHNYFVLTDMFMPILVKNCHGSGRTMSRHQAKHQFRGDQLQKDMEQRGIYVKSGSMSGLAEEAGSAYKEINDVIDAVAKAGISKPVTKLIPIGNVKG